MSGDPTPACGTQAKAQRVCVPKTLEQGARWLLGVQGGDAHAGHTQKGILMSKQINYDCVTLRYGSSSFK